MKKSIFYVYIILIYTIQFFLTSCDTNDDNTEIPKSYFSFTYNGKQYDLGEFNNGTGGVVGPEHPWIALDNFIWINRPDIFGGVILFKDTNCTFFSPVHNNLDQLFQCQLTLNGIPIDPVSVYFYKSGNQTYTSKIYSTYKVFDFFTGKWYEQTIFDINGTFDLELINSENKIIRITNGKYNIKRGGG
ncbi:hypothetical protein EOD40_08315 [Flavobacterium sufflavum]|uniref:Lipoprotein n=1 Tax=Flavobacterium sufflavum TaxID=1921138 RepID=A0A437KVQ5_9FLAO|nr:hypothetical protein [Flavobacterium sufflavum]RVT76500.1 hypothetical protein EOD40_08315 [Flavobacterium sufflavum]